jgi:uncharacterized membrane protein
MMSEKIYTVENQGNKDCLAGGSLVLKVEYCAYN